MAGSKITVEFFNDQKIYGFELMLMWSISFVDSWDGIIKDRYNWTLDH